MKFPQELNGYMLKTKASHLDGGHHLWSGMERDGLRHATLPKTHHMKMTTIFTRLFIRKLSFIDTVYLIPVKGIFLERLSK